ncbi:methyltransferase domain-containing protein [Streptosporangium saharense]|uniref:methyltransferase domain-containing protein n=1 Tax=Streptosporangium saharense TaxID=1706840 RepID=UPI0036AD9DBF
MPWEASAAHLAARITRPSSPWRAAVAAVPRHHLVPRWWAADGDGAWKLADGVADVEAWMKAAYSDRTLVTRIGPLHADHATEDDVPAGMPTSSSTLPSLLLTMYRHADLDDGVNVLDVGTGVGYGTALLSKRLGEQHVTSVDVDPHLTRVAEQRLAEISLEPKVATIDAAGEVPGTYDRIIATVSVRPVPPSWLRALKPGGRLVTTIAGTSLILTADKDEDGGATGRIEWDRAGFMRTRHATDYPAEVRRPDAWDDGEHVSTGAYPVINVVEAWDIASMLDLTAPGISHNYTEYPDNRRVAWMSHADGSWARAEGRLGEPPTVHQSGPRKLWDLLDEIRRYWMENGELPVRGARALIRPDGRLILVRGQWKAVID